MNRRDFLSTSVAATAALATTAGTALANPPGQKHQFQLAYAPHFGMFKENGGPDPLDQLKYIADQGFTALEDNGMKGRPIEQQTAIAKEMERLGLRMGVFVANGSFSEPTFASGKKDLAEKVLAEITESVEIAKRVNAKWMTVVPGVFDHRLPLEYQTTNVIELLRRCADILEPHNLVMVLEPLNHFTNHPELFLYGSPQAFMICKSVASPSCKILFDIYHQQITEGNLIPNIDHCWDEIGYFQAGDNPGRKEPGTGEINYRNVFQFIHSKGFDGIVGMEHGNSKPGKEGEDAVLQAYIEADKFTPIGEKTTSAN